MSAPITSPEIKARLGENLVRCHRRAGLSQDELSIRASLHRTEISQIERGLRVARADTLVKLAGGLRVPVGELVDAAELARHFGIERSWVYTHAIELGAVKLGDGAKPRLRFDPQIAARVLRKVGERSAVDPPARSGERAGQPQCSAGSGELLPIRGRGESRPPSAA